QLCGPASQDSEISCSSTARSISSGLLTYTHDAPWCVCLTCRVIAPTAGFLEFHKAKAWPCAAKSPRERYLLRVRWRIYSAPDHNQSSTVPTAVGYHP